MERKRRGNGHGRGKEERVVEKREEVGGGVVESLPQGKGGP